MITPEYNAADVRRVYDVAASLEIMLEKAHDLTPEEIAGVKEDAAALRRVATFAVLKERRRVLV